MGQGPFAKRSAAVGTSAERRRSTHVEHAVPVVISGRDLTGQPFREVTQTFSVSFHGAAIRTRKQILIGTQLNVECPTTGIVAKAICVRVSDPAPGEEFRAIAIQLLMPGNIWGVRNPPADWAPTAEKLQHTARTAAPSSTTSPGLSTTSPGLSTTSPGFRTPAPSAASMAAGACPRRPSRCRTSAVVQARRSSIRRAS